MLLVSGTDDKEVDDYDDVEDFVFNQAEQGVNRNWIILDTGSTTDIFCNDKLLSDIHETDQTITIHCNAGTCVTNKVGTLSGYGEVWFSEQAIANILSLANVSKRYPVVYNSKEARGFVVMKPDRKVVFHQSPQGLFYHDTTNRAVMLVNTVHENMEGFTKRQVERAKAARRALGMVGYPSSKDFKAMVRTNLIKNCPVTVDDINTAERIFGPDLPTLKGKTVRQQSDAVVSDYVHVPPEIKQLNKRVTLGADVMFVDSVPFFITVSRGIKFITVEYVPRRTKEILGRALETVAQFYRARGFRVDIALMDGEFECLRTVVASIQINTTAASEHVSDVERVIRLVKERSRATKSTLPFRKFPQRVVIGLVYNAALWLNAFPPDSGVSRQYSPRTILTGTVLDFEKHCRLPFGAYVEVHEDNTPTNTMEARTQGAICLGPTGNLQGSYKFLCLATGRRITRKQFVEMPMPQSVIDLVESMEGRPDWTGPWPSPIATATQSLMIRQSSGLRLSQEWTMLPLLPPTRL